jgi:hypothetical protein
LPQFSFLFATGCILVTLSLHNKIIWIGYFKEQNFIFSEFWRLEVHDQNVSWFGS